MADNMLAEGVSARMPNGGAQKRGCIFYGFGERYALRMLVAVFSLRQVYRGDITVFLAREKTAERLGPDLERLGCQVVLVDYVSKSCCRDRVFLASPYETTLVLDSDMVFLQPIDELWEPTEREGLLVTRFYPCPYGIEGSREKPGWANRVGHLESVREFVEPQVFSAALARMLQERIDVNVGVMGIAKRSGGAFLEDYCAAMERARPKQILLADEMLTVALIAKHRHDLAEEAWNCPADELFRRTNPLEAKVLHYFGDGCRVNGLRLGRNLTTWAGRMWYRVYELAARELDLDFWERRDPLFTARRRRSIKEFLLRRY